ncbi:MAG: amidophosphoribosyltransferase [Clostridia bacterium]
MGGIFGVVSKTNCIMDLFLGVDYHSHLGTRRGGLAVYNGKNFERSIHNIENSPFRTKFENDINEMAGNIGIGCISDTEPQPLVIRSHFGTYAITTVGRINNKSELEKLVYKKGTTHFLEMSSGDINATELVATLINQCNSIEEGIEYVQTKIDGSMTMLIMTSEGIYCARDYYGRTPLVLAQKKDAICVAFESHAYLNLGYTAKRELGSGEIVFINSDTVKVIKKPNDKKKICAFLWTYYGYPTSSYEGMSVERMRYTCGALLAESDKSDAEYIAGVPDSGTAHAIGYANKSGIPFARPFIKYTPTWARSFMPSNQNIRNLVAKMKLIPVESLIRGKKLLFIDDSIVRGTQMRGTAEFLYKSGAEKVHIRSACPPILYGCKYLNFSRSTGEHELISRRIIAELEGNNDNINISKYADDTSLEYQRMVDLICKNLGFSSLKFNTLDNLIRAIGIDRSQICTYCWNGVE